MSRRSSKTPREFFVDGGEKIMSYSLLWEIQYLPRHRELVSLTDGQWAVMMKDGEMGDLKSTCRAQKCVDLSPVAVGECISDLGRQISQIAQMSFVTLHYHYFHLCLQIQSSWFSRFLFIYCIFSNLFLALPLHCGSCSLPGRR